ncbi:Wzz/FepE/Etk N-terminal domain-containing protein [Salinarimonas sp.]|uniref:Wzz/FepE/Etk N-terminal domain-containing protein n=1 Tax=Salinarimonas sp. TaxID=2766526 RepID=UPI0032D8FDFD
MARHDADAHRRDAYRRTPEPPPETARLETQLDLPTLVAFLWRRAWIIAAGVAVAVVIGALYAFTAQPKYAAVAGLVIDETKGELARVSPGGAPAAEDLVAIATQIQILRSQDVALSVVDRLDLTENPLFIPDRPNVVTAAIGAARSGARDALDALFAAPSPPVDRTSAEADAEAAPAVTPRERAAVAVRSSLDVYRLGASRAIDVRYTGNHPEIAAAIANAVTEAYIQDRIDARFDAADNAGAWLRRRIAELQDQFADTARRVQAFRAENDIIDTGGGRGLINQQALAQVNESLVRAASDAAEARARYARVQRALAQDDLSLERVDAGESDLVTRLRSRYIELSAEEDVLSERLAPDNPALTSIRRELARTEDAIRGELRRVAERLRTEQDIAAAGEADLRDELRRLVERSNVTEEARVRLLQLESEAEVLQTAYESYLKRYTDVIQQQSAPFLEARTISPALVPSGPTGPRKALVLILSAILGGGLGLAAAVLLEGFDRTIRLPRQLEAIGVRSLGIVPLAKPVGVFRGRRLFGRAPRGANAMAARAELSLVASAPGSPFANGLRRVKTQVAHALPEGEAGGAVIGVTGLCPGEGASTIAANLARLYAVAGRTALLVDANLHDGTLTEAGVGVEPEPLAGAKRLQVVGGEALFEQLRDPADNDPTALPSAADLLASTRMRQFMKEARQRYEITILDLPALESVPDTGAVAPYLDGIVLVAEWGRASRPGLEDAVADLRRHGAQIVGAILNKARLRAMRSMGHRPTDLGYRPRRRTAASGRAAGMETPARETAA